MSQVLTPLDDRIVVRSDEPEKQSKGGILLPDNAQKKPQRGTVIAVGPGKLLESGQRAEPSLRKGDKVLYGRYAGSDVEVDGTEYKILAESDVLAKVHEQPAR